MAGARRPLAWVVLDALIWLIQLISDATAWLRSALAGGAARAPPPGAKTRGSRPSQPHTASVVFAEPDPHEISLQRAANVALWCADAGLDYVYLFDPAGLLKTAAPLLARRLRAHPASDGLELRVLSGWSGLAAAAQPGGKTAAQLHNGSGAALWVPCAEAAATLAAGRGQQQQDKWQEGQQHVKSSSGIKVTTAAAGKQQQQGRQQQQDRQQADHRQQPRRRPLNGSDVGPVRDTQPQPDQPGLSPSARQPAAGLRQRSAGAGMATRTQQLNGAGAAAAAATGAAAASAAAPPTGRRRVTVHLLSAQDSAAPAVAAALMPAPPATAAACCAPPGRPCACADGGDAPAGAAEGAAAGGEEAPQAEAADRADPAVVYAQLAAAAGPEVLREPQLLLVYGPVLTLAGCPPLHARGAQIYHLGPASEARADGVRGALARYARALQRHGA